MTLQGAAFQATELSPKMVADADRLNWSKWFRCESSFSLLLVPSKPGIFAVGEEVMATALPTGKRMLAVLQFAESDDLARALGRLFTPAHPLNARFAAGNCLIRYAVIDDEVARHAACTALQDWLAASAEALSSHETSPPNDAAAGKAAGAPPPAPFPAGF